MPSSIGISSPTSHWYARLCISFLLKRHPEIALAVKDDSELADCIWNGVEEVSHRGTDFLSVRSAKERKEYFDRTFGGMCIKRIHYFQLTLNHFICSVLSKFTWIPYCVFFDYICLLILFSLLVGVTETNFTEYNKSDFIFWVTSLYQFVHLDTCDRSSEYYWAFLLLLAPISFFRTGIKSHDHYLLGPVRSFKHRLSKQGKCLLDGTHVGDSIHPSTEAYTFLSVRGKFLVNSTLKNFQYLDEDTDIPEQFLNATTYEEIVLIGGSAKGRNNLNGNSSCRVNGLTFCWNDETLKYYRELLVDIEQQNAIEKE